MSKQQQVRESLSAFITEQATIKALAQVMAVDESAKTCSAFLVQEPEIELQNIRLAAENTDGWLMVPKLGSRILVAQMEGFFYVEMFSELAEIRLSMEGQQKIQITANEILLDGGSLGGLLKVAQVQQKFNLLERKLNSLQTLLASHVHTSTAPGTPTSPSPQMAGLAPLAETQRAEIENTKIKH